MSYTMTTTQTKPLNSLWYNDYNPDSYARFHQFIETYPGVLSYNTTEIEDNVRVTVIVFQDQAAWQSWNTDKLKNTDVVTRLEYLKQNNFQSSTVFS